MSIAGDLFAQYRLAQSQAGHMVLLRDGYPIAQGSMATVMLNPFYWLTTDAKSITGVASTTEQA